MKENSSAGQDAAAVLTSFDSYLFHEGTHSSLYQKLGAHPIMRDGVPEVHFSVWAPHAKNVELITSATGWEKQKLPLHRDPDGIWNGFSGEVSVGNSYRYIVTGADGVRRFKSDPFAFSSEQRPSNASVITGLPKHSWRDQSWEQWKKRQKPENMPMSIYEVHLGSWMCGFSGEEQMFLNYKAYAEKLAGYCSRMGYTHVELMGICEHPFDGSWGYQVSGYFAPTSRHGTPEDFQEFVDLLHQKGIGVILDWVPAHFVKDDFSLGRFDGTALYEPEDPELREFPAWGTYAFDHGKREVRSFLVSSALYWIREYHIDALRVDAVASMLYRNYSRPVQKKNQFGDDRNLESIAFLKQLNQQIAEQTNAFTIAEDSSIEAGMTLPVSKGGYGFGFKWNLGWMHDSLDYLKTDPVFRSFDHGKMVFTVEYTWKENYILVLSHDEVVHLKGSLFGKMPGNQQDRFGTLASYYTWMFTHPGKKHLFMGQDLGQEGEWSEKKELDWNLENMPGHRELAKTVKKLNLLYQNCRELYGYETDPASFEWINAEDSSRNIFSFVRKCPEDPEQHLLTVINFSPVFYPDYSCGVLLPGSYLRVFSSYDSLPGEGGPEETGHIPELLTENRLCDGRGQCISYGLRPNEAVIFRFRKSRPVF